MVRPFLILFLFFSITLYSQTKLDSLKQELSLQNADSTRVKLLLELFHEYQQDSIQKAETIILEAIELSKTSRNDYLTVEGYKRYGDFLRIQSREDSAIAVHRASIKLAEKNGFLEGKSDALVGMGNSYWQKGDFDQAIALYEENIVLTKKTKDLGRMSRSYVGLGAIHSQSGDYTKAMEYFTMASKNFLQLKDERNYAVAIGNIGYIQRSLENYESAVQYFKITDSVYTKLNNVSGQAFSAYNLSVVYKNIGKLDSAIFFNTKGRELYTQLGYKKRVSYCYFTLGEIYRKQENFQDALKSYRQSLEISQAVDDSVQIGYSSMAVADMYGELKDDENSITYLDNAAKVANALKLDILAMDIHERLAKRYARTGNTDQAYRNLQEFVVLKDSLYTKEKRELGSEIEAKYQNEQKTKEIALLASEKELQTLQLNKRENERNAIIALALLALLSAVLAYNQYRIKKRSNKELQHLDKLKSNFFANISHEFRTPLTLIKGPIEHLEQNPDDHLMRADIKMIRRNTNKVLSLVNQLLELSRIDQGKLQLKPTEGDIYKFLSTAASSFNSHAAQRNMDYRVTIPEGFLWASFDRDKLEKVVYNLLSNAFKFSQDHEFVGFSANYVNEELIIKVSDSGRGISEEKLPFIFDRFYQVDGGTTKDREGSGIGLSLSKDLVELMDGTITVSSEEGKGTFFTIQLPIEQIKTRQADRNLSKTAMHPADSRSSAFDLNKEDQRDLPQILLVEDNEDMRQFIKGILLKKYRIHEAMNGQEGMEQAISKTPSLIITDLMMPKMDGIELCKKLKTNLETSHIPIIMLTARAGIGNKIEGLESGADEYLTKPFDADELDVRVKNLVAQRLRLRDYYDKKELKIDPDKIATSSLDKKFLEGLLALLEAEYMNPNFGVPEIQKGMAMSRSQLHRKLRALTGESPSEVLRNFRLKRAAQLLSQKADTVTQIAYQVGFNNLSYFAKCFKELYGVSPSAY